MKLVSVNIRRRYAEQGFTGKAEFDGEAGSIELNLTDDQARQIVNLCADSLIEISCLRAADMKAEIIEGQLALPAKDGEGDD